MTRRMHETIFQLWHDYLWKDLQKWTIKAKMRYPLRSTLVYMLTLWCWQVQLRPGVCQYSIVGYSHVTVNEGVGGEKCCTARVHMKRNTYERKTMQNISYHSMESPKRSVCWLHMRLQNCLFYLLKLVWLHSSFAWQ